MTVSTTGILTTPAAMGGETFNFTFRALDATHIEAWVDGEQLTYTTDYTVVLDADGVGGTVTIVDYGDYDSGDLITLKRVTPKTQTSEFTDYGADPAINKEDGYDKLTLIAQETGSVGLSSTIASAATIAIPHNQAFISLTGTTTTKAIVGTFVGHRVVIETTGSCTISGSGDSVNIIVTEGSSGFNSTEGDLLYLVYNGSYWKELSRTLHTVI